MPAGNRQRPVRTQPLSPRERILSARVAELEREIEELWEVVSWLDERDASRDGKAPAAATPAVLQ